MAISKFEKNVYLPYEQLSQNVKVVKDRYAYGSWYKDDNNSD